MSYVVTKPAFETAAARKFFIDEVTKSFEGAQGHAELIMLYEAFEPKFIEMMGSHNEYDHFALQIINARYNGFHERIDESRDWVWQKMSELEESKNKM